MNIQDPHDYSKPEQVAHREDEFIDVLEGFLRRSSLEQTLRLPRWMMWSS